MSIRTAAWMACACLAYAGATVAQAPDLASMDIVLQSVPDGPVAAVNGTMISKSEFVALYRNESEMAVRRAGAATPTDLDRIKLGMGCVMMLVERELLLQEAKRRNIVVSKQDIENEWKDELASLQKSLAESTGKQLTEAEVLAQAGATREEALADLEKALRIEKVRDAIIQESGLKVSDEEVNTFYAENKNLSSQPDMLHLKQIYFRDEQPAGKRDEAKRAAALKRAEDALNRIRAGQKFETVAKAVSDGKYKEQGGDFGPLPASQVPPFLTAAAAKMKPGDVSGIIESDFGVHIIMLVGSVPGKAVALDDVRDKIKGFLLNQKGDSVVKNYCKSLMEKSSDVKIYLDFDKQLAARPDLADALKQE